MADFSTRQVTVTMTGAQWFAILARITYSTPQASLFSADGAKVYNAAAGELKRQIVAQSK